VSQLNQTTQQNASSSEELAATSEEMSSQAEQLQQTMSFFKLHGMGSGKPTSFAVRKSGPASKPAAARSAPTRASNLPTHSLADIDETQFTKF
jgi:methyl-accepting chemotaxis protein